MASEIYDIAIIGGGPVGMFAAFYASLRDTKVVLIESMGTLGGQVTALYPEKKIYDVAGFPGIRGVDFISSLKKQLSLFPVDIKTETTVTNIEKKGTLFTVTTDNHMSFQAKTIVVATGKGSFEPRKMQVSGINELVGQGVHYFVTEKSVFDHHAIAIAGGGDSAVDMATMLNDVTTSTTIIHRREQFRAMEQSIKKLKSSTVVQETPKKIISVAKQDDGKLKITLAQVKDDTQTNELIVDDLIINYGFVSESKTIDGWQIQLAKQRQGFTVNQLLQTNISGVFSIGDASYYEGKSDLIAVGFGEAPQAINSAIQYFDPNRGGPGHSSSMGIEISL